MIVESTSLFMAADHRLEEKDSRTQTLRIWIDPPAEVPAGDRVTVSAEAKEAAAPGAGDIASLPPKLLLIKKLIEAMTGKKIRLLTAADLRSGARQGGEQHAPAPDAASAGPERAGWGIRYEDMQSHTETETTTFRAAGIAKTADGREVSFALDVQMARSFATGTSLPLRAGDALLDPLVVNFQGPAATLADQTFSFDLNADGNEEVLPFVQAGSGLLAFDLNGDGRVNDGRELFGPATGNGFGELARYDGDGNGWIDEKDTAYNNLSLWTKAADGTDILTGLKASGVGAVFTGYADTSFALKDDDNNTRGQIRRTGLYLTDSGRAGSIQQLDIAV